MQLPPTPRPPVIQPPRPPRPKLGTVAGWLKNPKVWIPLVILLAILLLAGGSWLIFRSWLVAMVVALGIVLIALVVILLRTLFRQDRDDRIERGIGEQDQLAAQQQVAVQAGAIESLDSSFARAVREIRGSRLGAGGVDTLPWLLVLGEPGGGKSELLRNSGLELPAEYSHMMHAGPTADLDWWLTNQAIVLDTAGRYLEADSEEVAAAWRRLLGLLRRSRPKIPLDGLVIAVPLPTLFGRSVDELMTQGHTLRRRINEVTDTLGVDVPIYIVVTKCDQMEGFNEVATALPPSRMREAFGWTNDRRVFADAGEIVRAGFEGVIGRIEKLLPEMLLREGQAGRRRRIFLFPQEFEDAVRTLAGFLSHAFAPSVYDEVPFLRGVYFTSAVRGGATVSPLLQRLGHGWARTQIGPDSAPAGGLFLHDVFREVITEDRELAMPVRRMGARARRFIVYTTAFFSLLALGFSGVSFVDNLQANRRLGTEARAVVSGASSLLSVERLRDAITAEAADRMPFRGAFLNSAGDRALERARTTFVWAFGREFEEPAKNRLISDVRRRDRQSFQALADLGLDVTWMNVKAQGDNATRPELARYAPIGRAEADLAAFRDGYDDFVRWIDDLDRKTRIERERDAFTSAAQNLLEIERLEKWSNDNRRQYPPVAYADFDIPVPAGAPDTQVLGAYTRSVWESLVQHLIEATEETGGASKERVSKFRTTYVQRYNNRWRNLLLDVPQQSLPLEDIDESPYLDLLAAIHIHTQADLPWPSGKPAWISTLAELRRNEATDEEVEAKLPAPWGRYEAALDQVGADLAAVEDSDDHALDLAIKMARGSGTSFHDALATIRKLVPAEGDPQAATGMRELLALPVLNAGSAVLESGLESLDDRWRDRIGKPFSGNLDTQGLEALYRPEGGELTEFLDQGLGSFTEDGEREKVLGDRQMALGLSFLDWLQAARRVQQALFPGLGTSPKIAVRLEGVPADVVGGSGLVVTRQDLRLACEEVETFTYRQGTGSRSFQWTPDCEQVTLRVWARSGGVETELLPRREWNGPLAFPQYLQEAERIGGRTLQWSFQYERPRVELVIEYRLRSGEGILKIAHRPPPMTIRE